MAIYLENTAFGMGAISLTSITTTAKVYAGQAEGAQTKDTTATAIDMSKWSGNYKDRSVVRLTCVKDVVGPAYLVVTFYYLPSASTATGKETCYDTHKIPLKVINGAKFTPLEFSLPSVGGEDCRYVRMEIAGDGTTAVSSGAVLATVEQTRL